MIADVDADAKGNAAGWTSRYGALKGCVRCFLLGWICLLGMWYLTELEKGDRFILPTLTSADVGSRVMILEVNWRTDLWVMI